MSIYLSIVVPLYNEEESVEKLLSRILEVGKKFDFDYEIIFVDDGSTDKSFEILAELQKADPRVRVIRFRKNFGQTSSLNGTSGMSRKMRSRDSPMGK